MKNFYKIIFIFFCNAAFALTPETHLQNEAQEARAMNLFREIKCLVCEAQSIESSSTEFSSEMRILIRKKISENESDAQIKNELRQEFGENILMSPQIDKTQIFLWLAPFLFLGLMIFILKRKLI